MTEIWNLELRERVRVPFSGTFEQWNGRLGMILEHCESFRKISLESRFFECRPKEVDPMPPTGGSRALSGAPGKRSAPPITPERGQVEKVRCADDPEPEEEEENREAVLQISQVKQPDSYTPRHLRHSEVQTARCVV